jgi:glutamate dehydrogenase
VIQSVVNPGQEDHTFDLYEGAAMSLDAETKVNGRVRDVQKILGKGSQAASLAALLYGHNGGDALERLTPQWLADNAREALQFIAKKPIGRHKIGVRHIAAQSGGATAMTLLEILNDDMPFLVDSVMAELQARGLTVHMLLHPIFTTERDKGGQLSTIAGLADESRGGGRSESYIAVYLPPLPKVDARGLVDAISSILDEVRLVVADWRTMLDRVTASAQQLRSAAANIPQDLLNESLAFLEWLTQDNFTFLGIRDFELLGDPDTGNLVSVDGGGLGVLRNSSVQVLRRGSELVAMTPEIRRFFFAPSPLIITKANVMSRVHRRVHMDYIGIKTYRRDGTPKGEVRVVGLFTSQAYVTSPREIPFLRHKVATVLAASGYPPASHAGKAIVHILETFPRDELFQIGLGQLQEWTEGILDLETRPRVRVFARVDRFDRFVSLLVYIPRDRYNSGVRERIGAFLAQAYKGRVAAFYPYFPDGPLVRVQFIIARYEGPTPEAHTADLERGISEIARTWEDRLASAIAAFGDNAETLWAKYGGAFSAGYAETFPAERALEDIKRIERLGPDRPIAIDFHREADAPPGHIHAAVYRFGGAIALSERVPVLENLGFSAIDERSYQIAPRFAEGTREVTLHDMVLEAVDGTIDLNHHDTRLEGCFLAVVRGDADNDGFNRLVVSAGADWREAAVIRAYGAYLRQLGSPFGLRYLADTLNRHAGLTRDLIGVFHLRFDPDLDLPLAERHARAVPILQRVEGALAAVPSLDEDRILRQFANLVTATVRTNFYQRDAAGKLPATIAFKFDSKAVEACPQPRPFREIWVYSPRVEGVHLRFASIARGGIRWSDRAQDFRTEVLGLVRAQIVKNAVIVPSGAKGGFLPKRLPRGASRDELQKEGIATYRIFISALLDITDNLETGKVVPPARVVRHDGDDPYLVVAADKGTATFSDFANEISTGRHFWLGDAFASGGSAGYDHKKMGITARGAWECVKRHFREMDVDIQAQPFRVVGVGDMSGDVFGNGMLLSPHIKLIAAFDHRDIFIDPDPDPSIALAERRRLFDLPRSSWQDYDKAKISKGGGVFSRASKAIALSSEMKKLLDLDAGSLIPNELIRGVLKCPTDLLWFGGIGTYVRASVERDVDVGDRANDPLRVAAAELNAKVIGEGANLGMTQRGRIEFAMRGGRVNTDFIDNSAGVNTSDQEVNIKIALGPATRSGKLGRQARTALLADMTEDVAAGSLRNNYQQSLALSLAERRSARDLPDYALLMHALEKRGLLDRALEALPTDKELPERARAGRGLTRPELAILLSYAKIALQHDLLQSAIPDPPELHEWLVGYFPTQLRQRFADAIEHHSLRREIIALGVTNAVVNGGGPAMAVRLADETRHTTADVALALLAVQEIFALPALWQRIDVLDGKAKGDAQLALYQATQDLVNDQTRWFLRNGSAMRDFGGTINRHKAGLRALQPAINDVLPSRRTAELAALKRRLAIGGVPEDLAADVAGLNILALAPSITEIANETGRPVPDVARAFLIISDELRISDLAAKAQAIAATDYYDRLAVAQAVGQLAAAEAALAKEAITGDDIEPVEAWLAAQGPRLGRVKTTLEELSCSGALTVSQLLVAAGQLAEVAAASAAAPATSARPARAAHRAKSAASGSPPSRKPARRPRS